jgi:NitT/TauT family transport system permease protein
MNRLRSSVLVAGVVGVTVFVAAWELLVRAGDVQEFVLLAPSAIVAEVADAPRFYVDQSLVTAWQAAAGLGIALLVATVLGALLSTSQFAERAAQPVLILILVAPWVAYITSVVIWLGAGTRPVLFMVSIVTLPAFTFAVVSGLRSADPAIRDVLASAGASWAEVLWRVRVPTALAVVTTAARFNIGLALAAAYFAEGANLSNDGLGAVGKRAAAFNNGEVLWATVACTALLGIAGLMMVTVFERTVLPWHASQR